MTTLLTRVGYQIDSRFGVVLFDCTGSWATATTISKKRKRGDCPYARHQGRLSETRESQRRIFSSFTRETLAGAQDDGSNIEPGNEGLQALTRVAEAGRPRIPRKAKQRRVAPSSRHAVFAGHNVLNWKSRDASFLDNPDPSFFDIDYVHVLPQAIEEGDQNLTARCLLAAAKSRDKAYISRIPDEDFTRALEVMQTSEHLRGLLNLQMDISSKMARELGLYQTSNLTEQQASLLDYMSVIRRSSGRPLNLEQYKLLLRNTALLDKKEYAHKTWERMMEDCVVPDRDCWNFYLSGVVGMRMYDPAARALMRILPWYMHERQKDKPFGNFKSYRVGRNGVKEQATKLFKDMLASGGIADELTYTIYMTAAAREGDIETVKDTLKGIWNIDTDAIMGTTPEQEPHIGEPMHQSNELYPSDRLLYTIAHCFGINNDIPTALRLVDYVARAYDIKISDRVWSQLFEWTFVLSIPRASEKKEKPLKKGTKTGQLPPRSYENLWWTFKGPPYNVQPTLTTYDRLIKTFWFRKHFIAIYEHMLEAIPLMEEDLRLQREAWNALCAEAERPHSEPRMVERYREKFQTSFLLARRNNHLFRRWLRRLLSTARHRAFVDGVSSFAPGDLGDENPNFLPSPGRTNERPERPIRVPTLDIMPQVMYHWNKFAPDDVIYEVPGGVIEFTIRTEEEKDKVARRQMAWKEKEGYVLDTLQKRSPRVLFPRFGDNVKRITTRMRRIIDEERSRSGSVSEEVDPEWSDEGVDYSSSNINDDDDEASDIDQEYYLEENAKTGKDDLK